MIEIMIFGCNLEFLDYFCESFFFGDLKVLKWTSDLREDCRRLVEISRIVWLISIKSSWIFYDPCYARRSTFNFQDDTFWSNGYNWVIGIQLRWFKLYWKDKRKLYNVCAWHKTQFGLCRPQITPLIRKLCPGCLLSHFDPFVTCFNLF